jgi:enamine deaminase RidA (YjgF/YER057c/UK114 family)
MKKVQRSRRVTGVHEPVGHYSHCVLVDGARTVFVAGQVAVDANGDVVGVGDIEAQCRQVFANIRMVLRSVGADLADIVKWTIYDTDVDAHYEALSKVREELMQGVYPASTKVQVARLGDPRWLLEVDVIAAISD